MDRFSLLLGCRRRLYLLDAQCISPVEPDVLCGRERREGKEGKTRVKERGKKERGEERRKGVKKRGRERMVATKWRKMEEIKE